MVMRFLHRRVSLLVVTVLPMVLACSSDPSEVGSSDALSPADTASWGVGVTSAPSTAGEVVPPVVAALRSGTHPNFERVTFEFGGGVGGAESSGEPAGRPGYRLEYVDRPLRACGSGQQIFPVGDGWLEIRLDPAAAHTEAGESTLGPREIEVGGPLLRRIYRTCDFEGVVTHVLALESPNEYRVFTLEAPLRIVVDVRR